MLPQRGIFLTLQMTTIDNSYFEAMGLGFARGHRVKRSGQTGIQLSGINVRNSVQVVVLFSQRWIYFGIIRVHVIDIRKVYHLSYTEVRDLNSS